VLVNISANPHKGTNFGIGHGLEEHYLLHLADRTSELTEKFQTTFSGQGGCRLLIHHETFPVGVVIDDSVTTFPKLKGSEHELKTTSKTSTEYFTVDDDAYAQRLAAAFKHAVEVCGGRPSTF
jgi:hypothetical protein